MARTKTTLMTKQKTNSIRKKHADVFYTRSEKKIAPALSGVKRPRIKFKKIKAIISLSTLPLSPNRWKEDFINYNI